MGVLSSRPWLREWREVMWRRKLRRREVEKTGVKVWGRPCVYR